MITSRRMLYLSRLSGLSTKPRPTDLSMRRLGKEDCRCISVIPDYG